MIKSGQFRTEVKKKIEMKKKQILERKQKKKAIIKLDDGKLPKENKVAPVDGVQLRK